MLHARKLSAADGAGFRQSNFRSADPRAIFFDSAAICGVLHNFIRHAFAIHARSPRAWDIEQVITRNENNSSVK